MTVWKYPLNEIADRQTISMPQDSQPLALQLQLHSITKQHIPTLWVLCDGNAPLIDYEVAIVGTGHDASGMDFRWKFLGTIQLSGYVWHYFLRAK